MMLKLIENACKRVKAEVVTNEAITKNAPEIEGERVQYAPNEVVTKSTPED